MRRFLLCGSLLALGLGGLAAAAETTAGAGSSGFALDDKAKQHLDVLLDGRLVARYMYAYDKAKLSETYKPYLHVFDAEGKDPITKGPGGTFTHHRGIFIGWRKIEFQGKSYDRWHMLGGEIVHQKFLAQKAGPEQASFTSLTSWNDAAGKPFVEEERTMTFRRGPSPARLIIDFTAKLTAPRGDVKLDGDPEHAGVQYRPANEVDTKETQYVFPKEHANAKTDLDYPWVGETYTLRGHRYSVVDMNHPDNPKNTKFSAYRDYGRFGAFFVKTIPSGQSLTVKYRFLIAEGEMPPTDLIEKCYDEYSGAATASAVPKTSVVLSDQPGGKAKKPAAEKSAQPKKPAAKKKKPAAPKVEKPKHEKKDKPKPEPTAK